MAIDETVDGKRYVSAVLDCFDGAIVRFKMANHMGADIRVDALTSAAQNIKPLEGCVIVTGEPIYQQDVSLYTGQAGALQSMSHAGRCYDNAHMEPIFARLKKECIYKVKTETLKMETVKSMVFQFIEVHYNRKRIYTTRHGYPPLMKRSQCYRERLSEAV